MPRVRADMEGAFVALWGVVSPGSGAPLVELPGWWSRRGAQEEARLVAAESGLGLDAEAGPLELRRLRLAR